VTPTQSSAAGAAPRTILLGAAHLLGGRVSTIAIQFVSLVIVGRTLGPSAFGTLQFAVAVFVYLGLVADLGLSIVGTRQTAQDVTAGSRILSARILQGGLIATAIVLIALFAPLASEERAVVLILTLGLLATAFNLRWFLQGSEQFRDIAFADTASAALQLLAALTLLNGPADVRQAAVVMIVGPCSNTVLTWARSRGLLHFRPHLGRATVGLVASALPLGIAVTATQVYYGADTILLGLFGSPTDVGLYAAAYRIVLACLTIPFAIHSVVLPLLSKVDTQAEAWSLMTTTTRWLMILAVPIAVGTTLTASTIVTLVFGPAYADAAAPLAILIWSCVTVSANAAFGARLLATGRDRAYVSITVGACVLNVGLNLVLIPAYGMVGAASVTILTEVVVVGLIAAAVGHGAGRAMLTAVRPVLVPVVVMALAVTPFRAETWSIPFGIVIYLLAAVAIGLVPRTIIGKVLGSARTSPGRDDLS
jgi:O-antigen/teichoic acid export membrane protein